MSTDHDRFGLIPPDWTPDAKITITGNEPAIDDHGKPVPGGGKAMPPLEFPVSWAVDLLTAWRERNAPQFGKQLAETTQRWAAGTLKS